MQRTEGIKTGEIIRFATIIIVYFRFFMIYDVEEVGPARSLLLKNMTNQNAHQNWSNVFTEHEWNVYP